MKLATLVMTVVAILIFFGSCTKEQAHIENITTISATEISEILQFPDRKLPVELEAERSRLSAKEQLLYDEYLLKILNYKEFTAKFESEDFTWTDFYRIKRAILEDYPECYLFLFTNVVVWDSEENPSAIKIGYKYGWIYSETFSLFTSLTAGSSHDTEILSFRNTF